MTLAAKNLDPDFNIGLAFGWLVVTPTSHCLESYSGIEDYELKARIDGTEQG